MAKKKELTAETKYQLLLQISHDIRDTLDVDETLNSILDAVESILDYDAAGIFVLNQGMVYPRHGHPQSRIAGIAHRGFDAHRVETDDMLMHGKGIVGHVIRTGESVVAPDVRLDPRYVVGRARTCSEIAVPIVREQCTIGALNLESDRIQAYETDDLEVLRFFAEVAAISISKAVLHQQLLEKRRIEDQLRTANEVQSRLVPAEPAELPGYAVEELVTGGLFSLHFTLALVLGLDRYDIHAWLPVLTGLAVFYYGCGVLLRRMKLPSWSLVFRGSGLVLAGTDLFYPPLGAWIAGWVAAPGVDSTTLVPYAPEMYDADAYEAMRAFREPFITAHEYGFYTLLVFASLHILAVVVTEVREGGGLVSAMITGRKVLSGPPPDQH